MISDENKDVVLD